MKPPAIVCRYCNDSIPPGPMSLVKEPHRAPMPAHNPCARTAVEDGRGRVTATPKENINGVISEPDWTNLST